MKAFDNIEQILFQIESLKSINGYLFCKKNDWEINPEQTKFFLFESREELDIDPDINEDEPILAIELDVQSFLELATFIDIIDVQKRQKKDSEFKDYLLAIQHYFKYDSFLKI